ncbi:MAG: Cof-type HAD-IIB family hydrolase [archaeon]|nr:Cof-type HAD-IIB family hydrolase [archaeon]
MALTSKLVAMDLDGTLIQANGSIPDSLLCIIKNLSRRGIKFAIVTGRMTETAEKYAKIIGGASTISYNGSVVKKKNGTYVKKMIPLRSVRNMIKFCRINELYLQMYHNGKIYASGKSSYLSSDPDSKMVESQIIANFTKIKTHPTPKMIIASEEEKMPSLMEEIKEMFCTLYISRSSTQIIEVTPEGIDKKHGLNIVAEDLGVDRSDVIAIGNDMNDLPMIEWAGTGIAVSNAPNELKNKANIISKQTSSAGVQEALELIFH